GRDVALGDVPPGAVLYGPTIPAGVIEDGAGHLHPPLGRELWKHAERPQRRPVRKQQLVGLWARTLLHLDVVLGDDLLVEGEPPLFRLTRQRPRAVHGPELPQ